MRATQACGTAANCVVMQELAEGGGVVMVLRSRRSIEQGEELTIDYAGPDGWRREREAVEGSSEGLPGTELPRTELERRRRWLLHSKHFCCNCSSCESESLQA